MFVCAFVGGDGLFRIRANDGGPRMLLV